MKPMIVSADGLAMIRRLEGCSLVMYRDIADLPTIGVGHLLTKSELASGRILINGERVKWADGITSAQADDLLYMDLVGAQGDVVRLVVPDLAQHQFDALVSFTFNVGGVALRDSTLLKRVNAKQFKDVPVQLMRWVYAGGKTSVGLKNRRVFEAKMWEGTYHA